MRKLIFTTIFFLAVPFYLFADEFELKDSNNENLLLIKMTGNRSTLESGNHRLHCSNKAGNRTYLNKDNKILFRASIKATHITIYSYPANKQILRVGKKINRFSITTPQGQNFSYRLNISGAELRDENGEIIGSAKFNTMSKNIKCLNIKQDLVSIYKWDSPNFAGLLWLAHGIPTEIRMILINELLR